MKKFGLSAFEKIKSRKDFEQIFSNGDQIFSSNNKVKAKYRLTNTTETFGVKFAVAVSKKLGTAVWRNKVKRLIREAYRQNKNILVDKCRIKKSFLEIIFAPQNLNQFENKNITLSDIEPPLKEIIVKLAEKI